MLKRCVIGLAASAATHGYAQPLTVPGAFAANCGTVAPSDTLTREFPRTHQQIISASQLIAVPIGASITQITFRASNFGSPPVNALGNWPPYDITFADYEIYLAKAATAPGGMSNILAANIVPGSELRVRDGALTIPAASFSNFIAPPGADPWGMDIQVAPFVYTGGDLVITIRHSGHQTPGTPRLFVDSVSNPFGPVTECMGAASQTATAGAPDQSLPFIFRVRWTGPNICYANCDHSTSTPFLNVNDFVCYLNAFAAGMSMTPAQQQACYANCDGSSTPPILNIVDFVCFNNKFAVGCTNP